MSERFRRDSAKKNSGVSKPQAFTYSSAQKWINHLESYSLPRIFNGFLALFQNAKRTIQPFPFSTHTISYGFSLPRGKEMPHLDKKRAKGYVAIANALDPNVWNIYYSMVRRLVESGNNLYLSNGDITFADSHKPYADQLITLENIVDRITELLDQADETLTDLEHNYLPKHAHDLDELARLLETIVLDQTEPAFTVKQILTYLRTHAHTFSIRNDCVSTTPNQDCRFYIITCVPLLSKPQVYDAYVIDTLPIIKPGILTDDWIQIQLDKKYILSNDLQVKIVDRSNFWCYPDQNTLCQVCVTRRVEHRTPSQCFISLISKHKLSQLLNYCDFKQLKRIWDQAIFLTDKIIAYVNLFQGVLWHDVLRSNPNIRSYCPMGI
jgi:hypothetical protein